MDQKTVKVSLCNQELIDENLVEFINIEEDIQGRDIMTFRCPLCGLEHRSYRVS